MPSYSDTTTVSLFWGVSICLLCLSLISSPVFLIYFSAVVLTFFAIFTLNKDSREASDTAKIFLFTFSIGLFLSIFVNLDYIENGVTFLYSDQEHFFREASIIASKQNLFEAISFVTRNYTWYKAAYALFGFLGYIDKRISGDVYFLPLLSSVAYVTALIPVFIYHILKLYVPRRASYHGALYYGLLTPIAAYSGYLLRDMHLALIFTIILFWIVREVTLSRILGIIICFFLVLNLRNASSLLVLALFFIYVWRGDMSRNTRVLFLVIVAIGIIPLIASISYILETTFEQLEHYTVRTENYVNQTAGLGKYLYSLPFGVRHILIIFHALSCFPFWGRPWENMTFSQIVMVLYSTITNIGWFFVFAGSILFSKRMFLFFRKKENGLWAYLLAVFFLYMLSNTSNMNLRRICYVFPYLYIPFFVVFQEMSKDNRRQYVGRVISLILILCTVYIFMVL